MHSTAKATPGTYRLDPVHSSIGFAVMHKVSRFRATFANFDATVVVDDAGEVAVSGSALTSSVQVKDDDQAADLRSPQFFDAARHPEMSFRSTSVHLGSGGEVTVTGELTIRGHTEIVEATGTLLYVADDGHAQERLGLDLEAVVDRTAFGLTVNEWLPGGGAAIANDVTVTAELELPRV